MPKRVKDEFTKQWITDNSLDIIRSYPGKPTLRAVHYKLVSLGMTNSMNHYKRVVSAMKAARIDGLLDFDAFEDHERETIGSTHYYPTDPNEAADNAVDSIKFWKDYYSKNRWENQPYYPEVFIEKKALQGVFSKPCRDWSVALSPCKGYPSLTFLYEASLRFRDAIDEGKKPIILYFGDYDPSGENIPEVIHNTLRDHMQADVEVRRIALMEDQVLEWGLPPAPTKEGDTRSKTWSGIGQVELDAVEPEEIIKLCDEAIESIFDYDLHNELREQETEERHEFRAIVKERLDEMFSEDDE